MGKLQVIVKLRLTSGYGPLEPFIQWNAALHQPQH